MAAYVDYSYYTTVYLGAAIASAEFPRLALIASAHIDNLTYYRAAAITAAATDTAAIDKIKMATCAVAEALNEISASGGVVQSESVGQASVSYFAPKSEGAKIAEAAKLYLGMTGLMYAGFTADE